MRSGAPGIRDPTSLGPPKGRTSGDQATVEKARETIAFRKERLETLAKSIPGVLYRTVDADDLQREARALDLLREHFSEWRARGYVPSRAIVPGAKTDEPIRTRGWTHWHHLFTPRHSSFMGSLPRKSDNSALPIESAVACLFGLGRASDWNSKLSRWWTDSAHEKVIQTFSNQALNTLVTFGGRGVQALADSWFLTLCDTQIKGVSEVHAIDVRSVCSPVELWITDPPYADAINYHELSEFFLAWYGERISELFPGWYADSKRALAVRGASADFRRSMSPATVISRRACRTMASRSSCLLTRTHQFGQI